MMLMVVSGRSGSGKSVALRVLEDLGYYCVDNLPVNLLPQFVKDIAHTEQDIAVSIDVRNMPQQPGEIQRILKSLEHDVDVNVLFLDADNKELVKRYSETRRLHPLSRHNMTLEQAITSESAILGDLKEHADLVIDTTSKSIHDLSETVRARVLGREAKELILVFESFGFKYGLPSDADYVFDVRFLPNPHWVPELKPLTGLDQGVKDFLSSQSEVNQLNYQIRNFIETWLPMLEKNNRSYVTVAIGCTGGQHRSVYIAQSLADYFEHQGQQVQVRHRTLEEKQ
ncbi:MULTISPECIES: RNase adapter RapZ [unclassified Photobacterium]|uniref:RNase adapter RapZ n=1 Tax=unclassified Photobacterium TaxID=2628852 RepID=UPI001EDF413D|nr:MULTISPECIES: RNase adapter RapZ [unclassified Photobacterium]MCG3862818.1 RNase adapter RapZ [Photobacterium sp. Ph6]MCG3874317.1 RNase adapter RapZ [Photobacterium sp. Ph5]